MGRDRQLPPAVVVYSGGLGLIMWLVLLICWQCFLCMGIPRPDTQSCFVDMPVLQGSVGRCGQAIVAFKQFFHHFSAW